jgi:hypothetical protein
MEVLWTVRRFTQVSWLVREDAFVGNRDNFVLDALINFQPMKQGFKQELHVKF